MDNDAKLRPLYLAKILYEQTDEEHFLTTAQLIQILKERYGIQAHRQTIKTEISLLRQFGLEIEEVKSTQNRYNLYGRRFDVPELKLLIDAVESSKFITAGKRRGAGGEDQFAFQPPCRRDFEKKCKLRGQDQAGQ